MKYLHAMVRVRDLDASLRFFRDGLGLVETRRKDVPKGRFTLVYLAAPENPETEIELTWNYDDEDYGSARNFGHLAFAVDDIYATCERLRAAGVPITREPGPMKHGSTVIAFVEDPSGYKIELIQRGRS